MKIAPFFSGGGGNFPPIFSVSRIDTAYLNGHWGYFHRSCNLVHIVSFGMYCSVLEWGWGGGVEGWMGWEGLISNLNSVCLRFTAALWKKGYSCYTSFSTNFALIYWTCLIGFGGKFHRSRNLVHTVRDLDWLVFLRFNASLTAKVIS